MKRAAFAHKPGADVRQMLTGTRLNATLGTASSGGMERFPRCLGGNWSTAAGGDAEAVVRVSFHVFGNAVISGG